MDRCNQHRPSGKGLQRPTNPELKKVQNLPLLSELKIALKSSTYWIIAGSICAVASYFFIIKPTLQEKKYRDAKEVADFLWNDQYKDR